MIIGYIVYYIESIFVEIALITFIFGLAARVVLYLIANTQNKLLRQNKPKLLVTSMLRATIPLYNAVLSKPPYAVLRIAFHFIMIIVPIWYSGHIELWADSRFELEWTPIPDILADWLTIILMIVSVWFLLRRILVTHIRRSSIAFDWVLNAVVLLTFASGFIMAHGYLDHIAFFKDYLLTLHIFFSELMLLLTIFLFIRVRIDSKLCVGCAACAINCPSEALNYFDNNRMRTLFYTPWECVRCGTCMGICPESALELMHHLSLKRFYSLFKVEVAESVELFLCQGCGKGFAPKAQIQKVYYEENQEYHHFCDNCKRMKWKNTLMYVENSDGWISIKKDKDMLNNNF